MRQGDKGVPLSGLVHCRGRDAGKCGLIRWYHGRSINPLLSNVLPVRWPRGGQWPGWRGSRKSLLIESGPVLSFLQCLKQCKNVSTPYKSAGSISFSGGVSYAAISLALCSLVSLALSLSLHVPVLLCARSSARLSNRCSDFPMAESHCLCYSSFQQRRRGCNVRGDQD